MTQKFFAASIALAALSGVACSVPRAKSTPARAATKKAPAKPAVQSASLQTGVNINAVTRNHTTSKVTLQLARDGKALLPIVISDKASDATKAVAADLKKYLDQMSGASFEIKTGDGASGIVLGTIKEFPVPALDKALEIVHSFDGKEAYAIRTREGKLLLLGATDKGASHAAYRFLEELGCRWFFPNPTGNWEVIPEIADLKFAKEITDRPAFLTRDIWYAFGWYGDDSTGHPAGRSVGADQADWRRRNHMGGSFGVNAGHAYDAIITANAAEFTKHPEYYALVTQADKTQKRQGNQFEYGNPALRKLVVDWAVKQFNDNPSLDMVSVDPADGYGISESAESKAYGEGYAGNGAFKLANEVAVALQKAFPGQNKMVGLYAYNWHSDPPPFALEPNVYIQLTMGFNAGLLTLDQLFEEWPKKAKNLGFYDYYSTWRWDYDMWPGGRIGGKGYAPAMIRRFRDANAKSKAYATSVSAESSNNWGVNGRGYYLASQLLWNPDLDENAILQDFYDKAFGLASASMKDYYDLQDNVPPMSPGVVGALFRRMGKAREAAKNDPAVMRRLDDLVNYLRYYDLNYRNNNQGADGKNAERTLEIQTLMYRNRFSNMNHWEGFRQNAGLPQPRAVDPYPWQVDKPITHEETEAWFQDGLKHYPELKIPPLVTFSTDLIPVNLGGEPKDFTSPTYQGGWAQGIIFHSLHGEPIRATLRSFAMYGGAKHSYELRDEKGAVLASGKPQGTEKGTVSELNVKVPKAGRYTLLYTDGSGSLWSIVVPKTQIFTFDAETARDGGTSLYSTSPDLYFYVPKGTKEINYYFRRTPWSNSGPHDVVAPDGSIQKTVNIDGDYVTVPVPEGMDGKAWHFTSPKTGGQFGMGYFHFFNVPGYLAPSPAQMLLPKDLVKKDGLTLVK